MALWASRGPAGVHLWARVTSLAECPVPPHCSHAARVGPHCAARVVSKGLAWALAHVLRIAQGHFFTLGPFLD
eukprot:9456556-Pyramimonas_sp.AAC.1